MNSPLIRCEWAKKEIFHSYHDTEWGTPVNDDTIHFEFLILEGAQAGLSWETILKKRPNYKDAFANFNPHKVAQYSSAIIENLMQNQGLVRNRLKLVSTQLNAKKFLEIQREFGSFNAYIWAFTNNKQIINRPKNKNEYQSSNHISDIISNDLKKRGFKFVGTTIIYAYLQAVGIIDDHESKCFRSKLTTK